MQTNTYLDWVIKNTKTTWWHDSADTAELQVAIGRGAVGVTCNPFLSNVALNKNRAAWAADIDAVLAQNLAPEAKAENLMRIPVTKCAELMVPAYKETKGKAGYVCSQVNPSRVSNREAMLAQARRYHSWAPNISVKLPATAAGLDVLEECIAEGICCTVTVSFTVPQVVQIGERTKKGVARAKQNGVVPGNCFAVIMIGRLDDYLADVAPDNKANVSREDIYQAGIACTKRAYQIYQQEQYPATLLVAALRVNGHQTELAGGDLVMSLTPGWADVFVSQDLPREERITCPVPADVVDRLSKMPEFMKAYEPNGMTPEEFITFGSTNRTLIQFIECGWKLMENFK